MSKQVERLERVLCAWEDLWFLLNIINRILIKKGEKPICAKERAMINYPKFRKFLLSLGKNLADNQGKVDAFCFNEPRDIPPELNFLASFAVPMASWCLHSRRVFRLKADLLALLKATSLDGILWKDVHFPFLSFALSLESPIVWRGDQFDFILVSSLIAKSYNKVLRPRVEFRIFAKECDQYQPLTEANRENIFQRIKQKQWERVEKKVLRYLKETWHIFGTFFSVDFSRANELVTESAKRVYRENKERLGEDSLLDEEIIELWDSVLRIVVGLCLYLKTLPSKSSNISDWRRASAGPLAPLRPKVVTDQAEICTVSSCFKLSREEKIVLGIEGNKKERARYELRCHFRQGHWRRRPGLGKDSAAEKTVWVRPTIVRRDRLTKDVLPGGSESIIE